MTLSADQVMKFEDRVGGRSSHGFQDKADISVKNAAEATDGIKSTVCKLEWLKSAQSVENRLNI